MYYAVDGNAVSGMIHEFKCLRDRIKWINQRPAAVALTANDWIVQQAVRERRVESHLLRESTSH